MSLQSESIESSYRACRAIARGAGSSFYPSFLLLSSRRRRAMEALYAFMRHTDDLADGETSIDEAQRNLNGWRDALRQVLEGSESTESAGEAAGILPALADTVDRFEVPHHYLFDVITGVETDLDNRRYETFDELARYCYRVASVVGLACLRIWGYRGEEPVEEAHACGLAFQLTNVLRDLREDSRRGRVYLPQEDLRQFGYSEDDLAAGRTGEPFRRLMDFQFERAERYYRQAAPLAERLEPEGRRVFLIMIRIYYRLLQQIEADPARVFSGRVHLGRWRTLAIVGRSLLRPTAKAVLP